MVDADLVPKSVLSSPTKARARIAAIAGAAAGGCALAGCWIRFDDGLAFRASLGLTSAVFGALTLVVALGAKSAWGAVGRALGLSIVLGVASVLIPSVLVASSDRIPFVACLVFGSFFGAFTGFVYGLFLAALAGITWRDANAWTHEGADRATRTAAGWALFPSALALATAVAHDREPISEWAADRAREAHDVAMPLGLLGFAFAVGVAAVAFARAELRIVKRRRWLGMVVAGDPRWSIRAPAPHDDLASLPRLRDGGSVLEYRGEGGAYRVSANGRAVAIL